MQKRLRVFLCWQSCTIIQKKTGVLCKTLGHRKFAVESSQMKIKLKVKIGTRPRPLRPIWFPCVSISPATDAMNPETRNAKAPYTSMPCSLVVL